MIKPINIFSKQKKFLVIRFLRTLLIITCFTEPPKEPTPPPTPPPPKTPTPPPLPEIEEEEPQQEESEAEEEDDELLPGLGKGMDQSRLHEKRKKAMMMYNNLAKNKVPLSSPLPYSENMYIHFLIFQGLGNKRNKLPRK